MLKPIFERWKKTLNAHVYSKCDSQIIEMGFRNEVYDVDINIGYSFWNTSFIPWNVLFSGQIISFS